MRVKQENDGIDHINVYSKGKTYLGRQLSNFAFSPFVHPEDGKFNSVEGYWYWLGCKDDRLRLSYGFDAKKLGRDLGSPDWMSDDEFKRKVCLAIECKIFQSKDLPSILKESSLPFLHYYVYGSKIVNVPDGDWILDKIEQIRAELKEK